MGVIARFVPLDALNLERGGLVYRHATRPCWRIALCNAAGITASRRAEHLECDSGTQIGMCVALFPARSSS